MTAPHPDTLRAEPRAVRLRNLVKSFGGKPAVDDVSLDIRAGEFVSLLGPSGCGKTTTLRMIAGFVGPDAGDIEIGGQSVLGLPARKRGTAMVFQDYALFPHRTVAQNIAFGLRMRRVTGSEIGRRVDQMVEMLGLTAVRDQRPETLSGGQRQRAALGRALVVRTGVVLFDEPLGALDLQLRKRMQLELKAIQHELGSTFVYVTHDQEEALTMSDRIAVMNNGKVEQFDDAERVYSAPASRFVANFIGESNLLAGRLVRRDAAAQVQVDEVLTLPTAHPGDRPDGAQVNVVLRPERALIGAEADASENACHLKVTSVVFAGALTRIYGTVASVPLQVCTAREVVGQVRTGDSIRIAWNADDVRVIDAAE
jgi:ABC-type Fe3+/spermidine/putrescine transport system ATPase subunit